MNNNDHDPLKEIVFIAVPDHFSHTIGDFTVDTDVLLPVHTGGDPADWNATELSWEMIVSGMLHVLAHRPGHEDADYYRRFVNHVRPEMVAELSQTGIIAARNEDFDKAEAMFRALTALAPERVEGPVNLAIAYQQRGESLERIGREDDAQEYFDRAYRIFRDLLQRDTLSPDVRLNAGLFFLKIRNYESAYDQLKQFTQESEEEEKIEEAARILREIESQNLLDRLFKEAFDFIKIGDEAKGIERIKAFIDRYPDAWNA
ncbi:MAG: tetratricopeptide repeat protein [Spirochaetales bacterium]|nr:tetratricopeptide repeat protein [Spirochaetales bacterium]